MAKYIPTLVQPKIYGQPVWAVIHPARGQSIARYNKGVWNNVVFKPNDGDTVIVYPYTSGWDLMKKYKWVFIMSPDKSEDCGWVSLLIPFEDMFERVETQANAE
jgi:hypothetical protein